MTLSVIIITKNEAAVIARCVESVAWADEIIVLDSGSTDRTCDIARQLGARVESNSDWQGFGVQKNRALVLATGDWVFSLDADEWVTPELRADIERALSHPEDYAAFRVPRLSSFCGRFMRHSGWWPDYIIRLFRRGAARFSDDLVHEKLVADGRVGTLTAPLMHEAIRDLAQAKSKAVAYSDAGARMLYERGKRASMLSALGHGGWTFIRTYFLRRGFLDGREGYWLARCNAEGSYLRYLKLMQLHQQKTPR